MNKVLMVFLSLSLSGSILALVLLILKPLVKNRLSQTWQYYIWLIVILRFLIPLTPQISVVGQISRQIGDIANSTVIVQEAAPDNTNEATAVPDGDSSQTETEKPKLPAFWHDILSNVWLLWFGVALVMLVHKVASYRSFVRFVRVGTERITDAHILDLYNDELAAAKIKRRLPFYVNNQVVSPMLVGIIRPALVIPVLETSDRELRNILRHELTHYKRLDFIYKWAVQITLCLHWFNPLVRLISHYINQSCELSCDEAVIKHLDEDGRFTYGDALIASLTAKGNYSDFVVSMTMSENGNIVKERLDMIMDYKKKSPFTSGATVILTMLLMCCFAFAGAYAAVATANVPIPTPTANAEDMTGPDVKGNTVINLSNNGQKNLEHASSFTASEGQTLTLKITSDIDGFADFYLISPANQEQRIAIGGDNITKTIQLSSGEWKYYCTGSFDSGNISITGVVTGMGQPESIEFFGETYKLSEADYSMLDEAGNIYFALFNDIGFIGLADENGAPVFRQVALGQVIGGATVAEGTSMGFNLINGEWELSESDVRFTGSIQFTGELTRTQGGALEMLAPGSLSFTPTSSESGFLPYVYGFDEVPRFIIEGDTSMVSPELFSESNTVTATVIFDYIRLLRSDRMTGANYATLVGIV